MNTLHEILWDHTVDRLTEILKLLNVKPASKNKATCIDAIKQQYEGPGLQKLWFSLGTVERDAVIESAYDPNGHFNAAKFKGKYGKLPEFYMQSAKKEPAYAWQTRKEEPTRVNLLLFSVSAKTTRIIPNDLAERLKQIIPKPPDAKVKTLAEPPSLEGLTIRTTEHEALTEIMTLLRLAEQGEFKVSATTGLPSAASGLNVANCLTGGDFYSSDVAFSPKKWDYDQQIGHIKPIGWALMLQNARMFAMQGTKSKLTPTGIKNLKRPPHEVIYTLWNKWVENSHHDEFNRINEIKGQNTKKRHLTAKPPRRWAIRDTLAQCPVNTWICIDDFSNFMQATEHHFDVSNNNWRLYLCDPQYGSLGYNGYGGWNILQLRYILVLFMEYAATLGLIDIAYIHPNDARRDYRSNWGADDLCWLSRYDGLQAFRITDLGAWCLGMHDHYTPISTGSTFQLSVRDDLTIHAVAGNPSPGERILLESWATPMTETIWQLTPTQGVAAVEGGQSLKDFVEFLETRSAAPMPETASEFFEETQSYGTALRFRGQALLFDCRSSDSADFLSCHSEIGKICHRYSKSGLVVPAAQEAKFRKLIQELGLGIV